MKSSERIVLATDAQPDGTLVTEQKLDEFLGDQLTSGLDWASMLAGLRNAGAIIKMQNGEAVISLSGRYVLVPKQRRESVSAADLAFLRRGLAPPGKNIGQSLAPGFYGDELRIVVALNNHAARIFCILTAADAPGFIALVPYGRHLYERTHFPPVATATEMDSAYFELLSIVMAPARQILLVERGVSTAAQRLLHFLRKHHSPIAARMIGRAAFGAPGGTDRALLGLARKYCGGL